MLRHRINQCIVAVTSGLMLVGSGFLIEWGPSTDRRGATTTGPGSNDSEAVADALSPVNFPPTSANDSEDEQISFDHESHNLKEAGLVTIRRVPFTDSEIEEAWKQASSNACEYVPANEPFEINRPTPFLTENDRVQAGRQPVAPGMRQHMLSIGLHLPREVQQSLPMLGKIPITDYIQRHYVTIQARVHRDPISGIAYLHHRPMAATMQYSGSRLTLEFTDTVARAVNDFRSLGLWLSPDEEVVAQNLRTLVLADRYETSQATAHGKPKAACELMFVRARFQKKPANARNRSHSDSSIAMAKDGVSNLVLHTFVTTDGRKVLHYIPPDVDLRNSQQCGIRVLVKFTSYAYGAYPTESVVIGQEVRSNSTYSEEKLSSFARGKNWAGDRFSHLSELLDAIIDKELTAD